MRILQVDLQNFHGFEEKSFSLSPSFSVLVGDNGTGKTGLLEALAVAAGALMVNFEDLPGRNIEPNKDCYRKATEIDGHRSTTRQFPVVVRTSGVFMDKQITWARSLESGFSPEPHEEGELQTISKQMWESRAARDLTNLPVLAYYGVGRNWPKPPTAEAMSWANSLGSTDLRDIGAVWIPVSPTGC
jgi:predicted ATP-binding protein involved in virulence